MQGARSEVWFQPLIDVGRNQLAFALHPLCYASSIRTAEWLLSRDRAREGAKGSAFEREVANRLELASKSNSVMAIRVLSGLRTTNEIGDIDVLLLYGGICLVIECKCLVFPATENDFFNRERTIAKASQQASRKSAYLLKNWSEFARRHKIIPSTPSAVVPLCLLSGLEYAGTRLEGGVAVTSLDSIVGVIANAAATIARIEGGQEAYVVPPKSRYKSADEGEQHLLAELNAPSLIEFYRSYLKIEEAQYVSIHESRTKYFVKYPAIVFSDDDKARYIEDLGLADHV